MHDLIIRNAEVFDGTGLAPVLSDVAVSNGRISQIGHITDLAHETIDAKGLALMPGIVDLHTHYDAQVTWDRTMSPSPALGVTTAVIGNCGFGIAPCPAPMQETMLKNLSVVEGMDLNSLLTGVNWEFESFGQYMDQLRRIGPYINTAVFAGPFCHSHRCHGRRRIQQGRPESRATSDHAKHGARCDGPWRHWLCLIFFT